MYKHFLKRTIDLIAAIIGLTILIPVILVLIIILSIANNGKPFYYQLRPGKNEAVFKLIKFKSMNDKKDKNGELLPGIERITPVGHFIRNYSLDEIPQLFNVLKGEMSLIGPRPLLIRYLPYYNDEQKRRHDIKPGITGWAQVNGRNNIGWKQKFEYDVWYVDNVSLVLDIKIILLTIKKVFRKKDIYNVDNEIGPEFTGTD
ncbi:sugar transferase [Ichthyenterobacterium sp. W332]|uniref:Sugar transferase n=1 Tax=Microcosmobacter mediterraneus TaxID=3075607 RepID=A0ABU2YKM4_9FLAO|nr:sugar transferase [Ichthyenterobacterium sp. W332]MDT0558727.1 sugar transferase [Ichthyenterobacterium sp. W332]